MVEKEERAEEGRETLEDGDNGTWGREKKGGM